MTAAISLKRLRVPAFDSLADKLSKSMTSFTEEEVLKTSFWDRGEEARLREDFRFRRTPGGRWTLTNRLLANNELYNLFHHKGKSSLALEEALSELGVSGNKSWIFCKADKRFVLDDDQLRLSDSELSNKLMSEEAVGNEKYETHLPIHSLDAVAASEPAGEWGQNSQEEMVETLGWVKVSLPGQKLNDRMFVARIKGSSMDDGRSGLVDGSYGVFELWPAGTRQNKIVLVRGAFKDPETGTYALKKYTADTRDKEGMHHRIALVSLNPDKEKYPDIILNPEEDESVKVMAQLLSSLSSKQYARQPKPVKSPGRRNLDPNHVANQMRKRIDVLFEKESAGKPGCQKKETQIRLVCLDFESGGLHVETDPQPDLPNFIKKVVLDSDEGSWTVLGSNLKNLKWRQNVTPSTNGYRWTAPGFEEDVEDELARLRLSGLQETTVSIFKVDALGVGRQVTSNSLTPGQEYRVIVPPKLAAQTIPLGVYNLLERGWQLWEFTMPAKTEEELSELFEKFGLGTGKAMPRLDWVVTSPVDYMDTVRGDAVPCFAAGIPLYVSVKGISAVLPEEVRIFIVNGGKSTSFPLPRGNEWYFTIEDLVPGKGLIYVLHKKIATGRAELPFCIVNKDSVPVPADINVHIKGKKRNPDSDGDISFKDNLRTLGTDDLDFLVKAPPLWPVSAKWQDVAVTDFPIQSCEPSGEYDTAPLIKYSERQRGLQSPGNLTLDFFELGRVLLQHDPAPDPELIRKRILETVETAGGTLPTLGGQFQLLRQIWFEPVLQAMGFTVNVFEPEDFSTAPSGVTALLVNIIRRKRKSGRIESAKDKIVVIVGSCDAIQVSGKGTAREYADELCDRHEVPIALVTDGRYWMRHKRGSKLKARLYDLFEIVQHDDGEEDFELFLSEVGGL